MCKDSAAGPHDLMSKYQQCCVENAVVYGSKQWRGWRRVTTLRNIFRRELQ